MANYRKILNAQGLKNLSKLPQIPDYHLMVGSAENLGSLPIIVYEKGIPKEVSVMVQNMSEISDQEMAEKLTAGEISINDMMANTSTIMSGLGGV